MEDLDTKPTKQTEHLQEKWALERSKIEDQIDLSFGYARLNDSTRNEKKASFHHKETNRLLSAVDCYFLQQDGKTFKAALIFSPYFFVRTRENASRDVEDYLRRKFQGQLENITIEAKIDLDQKNHLSGLTRNYMRLSFFTVQDLLKVRDELRTIVKKNQTAFEDSNETDIEADISRAMDASDHIIDIREFDVTYYQRAVMDLSIRAGNWYTCTFKGGKITLDEVEELKGTKPPFKVLAYDIECLKKPLKFPDPNTDEVMMISYMLNEQGYLIINREHVGADIEDFEYSPKPEYPGHFHIFNEPDETAVLKRFVSEIKRTRPHIFVTFNGDSFDWPFIEKRCQILHMPLKDSISLHAQKEKVGDQVFTVYTTHCAPHLDVYKWVARDSYLPQGSQGLKEVTRLKLNYLPLEVDPEEMVERAKNNPISMASYSVSDAVATYYLYLKYVEPFILGLCTIIPMNPDDVLRKGTGTLCESLLMVEARKANVIFPNKKVNKLDFYNGHLILSETYVGGHVESILAGVFRSDLPLNFNVQPEKCQEFIDNIDEILKYTIEGEKYAKLDDLSNYDEVKQQIVDSLKTFIDKPHRVENPLIYHVDVASMYPNIILTNRLTPSSIVDEATCAACLINRPESNCKRKMEWQWCVDYLPNTKGEYFQIKRMLETEQFKVEDPKTGQTTLVPYFRLPPSTQTEKLRARLKEYCKKVYKKSHIQETLSRKDIVCMRENPFYVDTVRAFRDRRYVYKKAHGQALAKLEKLKESNADIIDIEKCKQLAIYNEALQLAHKCILNSFYGYVVRKGARWYSMEMAGIVTHTGANIIKRSRETVEAIGQPLELDTDGIWCCLPESWPCEFSFTKKSGGSVTCVPKQTTPVSFRRINFLCAALNKQVFNEFANHQYQDLVDPVTFEYKTRTECTILFEIDGPYRAMVIPKSTVEEKQLKKRYAVFTKSGEISELKGFEMKRRGELKLIKDFQRKVFTQYLAGDSLESCYAATASVANKFLDIIEDRGENMDDNELLDLISESRNMSRQLEDYKSAKSMTITTAKRLGQFLGGEMVKDAGLSCRWIVSKLPEDAPVTERAVPTTIFNTDHQTRAKYLKIWLKSAQASYELRDVVDWEYYRNRLGTNIQKMITLPSFLQGVANPVPRVKHPDWILKRKREQEEGHKQQRLTTMFQTMKEHNLLHPPTSSLESQDQTPTTTHPKKTTKKGKKNLDSFVQRGQKRGREEESEEQEEVLGPMPDEAKDFEAWLAWNKKKWEIQRKSRKRRRLILGDNATRASGAGIGQYLQKQEAILKSKPWKILQIASTASPGTLKLWIITDDGSMHTTTLEVQRRCFINSFIERKNFSSKNNSAILPRMRQRFNCYEFVCSEQAYVDNAREVAAEKSSPTVEGFYESKVPLVFRAVYELGCVCSVKSGSRTHNVNNPWKLDQLESKSSKEASYLNEATAPSCVYLYYSVASDKKRSMLGLYFAGTKKSYALFYTPYVQQSMITQQVAAQFKTAYPAECELKISRFHDFANATKTAESLLKDYKSMHGKPIILLVQSAMNVRDLTTAIPTISEFPHMTLAPHQKESEYPDFGWFSYPIECFGKRIPFAEKYLISSIEMAAYAQVPICNLEDDRALFISDVMYARLLKQKNHVLWYSDDTKPDLGGNEDSGRTLEVDEITNPVICNPIVIQTISMELDMGALAINTILQASHIEDMEGLSAAIEVPLQEQSKLERFGGTNAVLATTQHETMDETMSCQAAFTLLSSLLQKWLIHLDKAPVQQLWGSFYRWLTSPRSKLYDPALHRLVHKLICKAFHQLISEIRNLGGTIIYANFNKLIIGTDKINLVDGESFFKFLTKTLRKKPLFKYVTFKSNILWDVLVFKDVVNFIGIPAAHERITDLHQWFSELYQRKELAIKEVSLIQPKALWNLAAFLPQEIEKRFLMAVVFYVNLLYQKKPTAQQLAQMVAEKNRQNDFGLSKSDHEILASMEKKLYEITESVTHAVRVDEDLKASEVSRFSQRNESQKADWSLEFVKSIYHVLSLNKKTVEHIPKINRGLLKLVGGKECAEDSEFVDPSIGYLMPDVMCAFCNDCRDVDLLRDPSLAEHDWGCPKCRQTLDKAVIENRLIDTTKKRIVAFQTQDLNCVKCGLVKSSNTQLTCSTCSGGFVCKESAEKCKKGLVTLLTIAKFHKFEYLHEIVDFYLRFN